MALMQKVEFSLIAQAGFTADHCLKCNICTAACPVMNVTDQFLGARDAELAHVSVRMAYP
jgi:succinate dehydrogenase/fumarate reductase-like Fe-S protein